MPPNERCSSQALLMRLRRNGGSVLAPELKALHSQQGAHGGYSVTY